MLAAALFLPACSSDFNPGGFLFDGPPATNKDGGAQKKDKGVKKDTKQKPPDQRPPDTKAQCHAQYPAGHYGSTQGSTVANQSFQCYKDPMHLCRDNWQIHADTNQVRNISLLELHKGWDCLGKDENACKIKKRSLLWVVVSTGWCGSCKTMASKIQSYKGQIPSRAAVLYLYTDGGSKGSIMTPGELKQRMAYYNMTFNTGINSSKSMYKASPTYPKISLPLSILIRMDNMKIIYAKGGGTYEHMMNEINMRLPSLP